MSAPTPDAGAAETGRPGDAEASVGEPIDALLSDEEVRRALELLFFAYRDFTGEPDAILAEIGFGRAHHRVVYFVGRNPSITVNQLLGILKITKQSLARVLGQLIEEGYIHQQTDPADRRRRTLTLTEKGRELEARLTGCQGVRIRRAYQTAGADAVDGFKRVLAEIINPQDRPHYTGGGPHTDPAVDRSSGSAVDRNIDPAVDRNSDSAVDRTRDPAVDRNIDPAVDRTRAGR